MLFPIAYRVGIDDEVSLFMATAFDVPSEGSLSLNGRATTYQ
jgi:hypothetical protein